MKTVVAVNKKVAIFVASCGVAGLGVTGLAVNAIHADAPATSSSQTGTSIGSASNGVITLGSQYRPLMQDFEPNVNQSLMKTLDQSLYNVELKRQFNASSLPQGKTLMIHVAQPQGSSDAISAGLTFNVSSMDQFNSVMKDLMNAGYQPGIYQHQDNNGKVKYTGLLLHSPSVMITIKDQAGHVLGYQAIYNTVYNNSTAVNMLSQLTKTNSLINIPFKNIYNTSVITYHGLDGKEYKAPYVASDMKNGVEYGLKNDSTTDMTLTNDMSKSPFEQLYLRNYEVTVQSPQVISSSEASSHTPAVQSSSSAASSISSGKDVPVVPTNNSGVNGGATSSTISSSSGKSTSNKSQSGSTISASSLSSDAAKNDATQNKNSTNSSSDSDAITFLGSGTKDDDKTVNDDASLIHFGTDKTDDDSDARTNNQGDVNGSNKNQKKVQSSSSSVSSSSSSSADNDGAGDNNDSNANQDASSDLSSSSSASSQTGNMPQTGEYIAEHPFAFICAVVGLLAAGGTGLWFINKKADKK